MTYNIKLLGGSFNFYGNNNKNITVKMLYYIRTYETSIKSNNE